MERGVKRWGKIEFEIEDDGDCCHVFMLEDGVQVAGMMIPDDGTGVALDLAIDFVRSMREGRQRPRRERRRGGTPKPPISSNRRA